MVGSDHDFDWRSGQFTANAAERAAYANGQESCAREIERLRAALLTVQAILNGNSRYKAREARLVLARTLDERP